MFPCSLLTFILPLVNIDNLNKVYILCHMISYFFRTFIKFDLSFIQSKDFEAQIKVYKTYRKRISKKLF